MKNGREIPFSIEELVGETFKLSEHHIEAKFQFEYLDNIKSYRLRFASRYIDFPKDLSLISEVLKNSFLDLKVFDYQLNEGLKDFLEIDDDIILYSLNGRLFIDVQEFQNLDQKKAA